MPLFTDEERAIIGTLYKQEGHDSAVERGCAMLDASWQSMLDSIPPSVADGDEVLVYCKRGGMRSSGTAWLLSQAPVRVRVLDSGYQAFRHWAREEAFQRLERRLVVLGGRTGSGKTDVLLQLRRACGAQVLDLEGDANHRGYAAFQPSLRFFPRTPPAWICPFPQVRRIPHHFGRVRVRNGP